MTMFWFCGSGSCNGYIGIFMTIYLEIFLYIYMGFFCILYIYIYIGIYLAVCDYACIVIFNDKCYFYLFPKIFRLSSHTVTINCLSKTTDMSKSI